MADLDKLRSEALEMARHLLEKRGGFLPFCVVQTDDGEVAPFIVQGDDPNPDAPTLIAWHCEEMAKLANEGQIVGSAMAVDTRIKGIEEGRSRDAVLLCLRSPEEAVDEATPYAVETTGRIFKKRAVSFDDPQVSHPERNEIFA